MRRCDYEDSSEDELVESFSSLSLQKGRAQKGRAQGHGSAAVKHSGRRFPEYEKELKSRPLSSARKASPPETGPCARASNGTIRRHLGLVGDPSADIDHLYEGHKARARGLYPEIEVSVPTTSAFKMPPSDASSSCASSSCCLAYYEGANASAGPAAVRSTAMAMQVACQAGSCHLPR
jgi:hypothetical protein